MSEGYWWVEKESQVIQLMREDDERCFEIARLKNATPFPWWLIRYGTGDVIVRELERCLASNKARWDYYWRLDGR